MSSATETVNIESRSRIAGVVLASLVVIVMCLFNLPYDYVEVDGKWLGGLELNDQTVAYTPVNLPRMAGWPFRYSVEYGNQAERELRYWSTPAVLGDLGITLCLSLAVYGFIQLRSRRTITATNQGRTRKLFDACIASAILAVPLAVVAWSYWTAYLHQRLAMQLLGGANTYTSCWLPEPIADQIPTGLMRSFHRLRIVRIVAANQSKIDALVEVDTLVALHCFGGTFDSSAIDRLHDKIHFSSLQLYGRSLSDADLEAVARLRWLTVLNLARSNLSGDMLRRLDEMRKLEMVNLQNTPLRLTELGRPQWSSSIRELNLSRPTAGNSDSLQIDGWPQLRRLGITRASPKMNASPLTLRLTNLPQLENLYLDRVQKHDLTLRNVPRLSRIEEGGNLLEILMGSNTAFPGQSWIDRLKIDGADSLSEIGCFARDMNAMSIRGVPNLRRLVLGSYLETTLGTRTLQPMSTDLSQRWIEKIGELDGPSVVDLFGLPLARVDLSPLANNSRIRHLHLGATGVSFEQLASIEGMQQLENLDLGACKFEKDELSWLLDTFPKLEDLTVNGAALERFDPSGRPQLRRLNTSRLERIKDIRIVDLPLLKTFIETSQTPLRMEIRNAQSLRGLVIEAPWPKEFSLSGLRDLDCFVGGGKALDDQVMDVILRCRKLDQLTLAYTSISREQLKEVGRLDRLSVLALPGADVDDEVTSHWHRLNSLWDLNLDDTSVSLATIVWVRGIDSLRRLSLNRVALDEAATAALGELRQVSELHLGGTSVPIEALMPLFAAGNLEVLDLSRQRVDSELVEAVANASSLKHLILRGSDVDADSLERMLASNPSLYVDLGEVPAFVGDETAEKLNRRSVTARRQLSGGWRHLIRMRGSTQWRYFRTEEESAQNQARRLRTTEPASTVGLIDWHVFRPASLERQSFK